MSKIKNSPDRKIWLLLHACSIKGGTSCPTWTKSRVHGTVLVFKSKASVDKAHDVLSQRSFHTIRPSPHYYENLRL